MRDEFKDLPDELLYLISEKLNYYTLNELNKTDPLFKQLNTHLLEEKGDEISEWGLLVHYSRNRRLRRLLPVEKLIQFGKEYPVQRLTQFMQMHYSYAHGPMRSNERLNELALVLIKMIESYQRRRVLPNFYKAADALNNFGDKKIFLCFMFAKLMFFSLLALDLYYTFGTLDEESKPSSIFKDELHYLLISRGAILYTFILNICLLSGYMNSPLPKDIINFEKSLVNFVPNNEAEQHYQELLASAYKELIGTKKASLFKGNDIYWCTVNQSIENLLKPLYYTAAAYQIFTLMPFIAPTAIFFYPAILNEQYPEYRCHSKIPLYVMLYASFAFVAIVVFQSALLDSMTTTFINGNEKDHAFQEAFKLSIASTLGLMTLMALILSYKFAQKPSAVIDKVSSAVSRRAHSVANNIYSGASTLGFWFRNMKQNTTNQPAVSNDYQRPSPLGSIVTQL